MQIEVQAQKRQYGRAQLGHAVGVGVVEARQAGAAVRRRRKEQEFASNVASHRRSYAGAAVFIGKGVVPPSFIRAFVGKAVETVEQCPFWSWYHS